MRFKKEIILAFIIVILIIVSDIITSTISKKSVEKISNELDNLNLMIEEAKNLNEYNINKKLENNIKNSIQTLKNHWYEEQNKLSVFIEHDELEKVTISLVALEENIKNYEFTNALEDGVEFEYWLNHFKEKEELSLKNIF